MNAAKPRLGRGLDALIGEMNGPTNSLRVESIERNPWQPRKLFDGEELEHLRDSIKAHGILQPLVVRKTGDGFQLIAGERRLRAAQAAGLREVPVHVVEFNDQQVYEAALAENIQRADLNAIEKAQGFKDYMDRFKVSHEQMGIKLGLDRTTISNLLGLLNLPAEVQDAVRLGQITLGHAKVLKGITSAAKQQALCKDIILKKLSVHALEQMMKESREEPKSEPKPAPKVEKTAHVESLEQELQRRLATRVEIKLKEKAKGCFVISFETNDDFERILHLLQR